MQHHSNPYQIALFNAVEDRGVIAGRRKCRTHSYQDVVSIENLLTAWREFLRGKRKRIDIAQFSLHLTDNIIILHQELLQKTYRHGAYTAFTINDPKPRSIHKATVRDRLVHHALYRLLYLHFDQSFIFDSFSCRRQKGTHRAINRFRAYGRKVSQNHTHTTWVLKCDIRKFFASIDHVVLLDILHQRIDDQNIIWLLEEIIGSFHTSVESGTGLPLGNLTSQLLVNIYMNEFDQFMKHNVKAKYYIRYADDFVIFHTDKVYLQNLIPRISIFLETTLKLSLHPKKLFIKTLTSGVDFLGWVHFPHHRVLRTTTKRRMLHHLKRNQTDKTVISYLGLLSHGNTYKLRKRILKKLKTS